MHAMLLIWGSADHEIAVIVSLNCLQVSLNLQRGQMREKCKLLFIKSSTTYSTILL